MELHIIAAITHINFEAFPIKIFQRAVPLVQLSCCQFCFEICTFILINSPGAGEFDRLFVDGLGRFSDWFLNMLRQILGQGPRLGQDAGLLEQEANAIAHFSANTDPVFRALKVDLDIFVLGLGGDITIMVVDDNRNRIVCAHDLYGQAVTSVPSFGDHNVILR